MTSAEVTNVEEMFVQVARGSSNSKSELTLNGVSPSTLYFSDRTTQPINFSGFTVSQNVTTYDFQFDGTFNQVH